MIKRVFRCYDCLEDLAFLALKNQLWESNLDKMDKLCLFCTINRRRIKNVKYYAENGDNNWDFCHLLRPVKLYNMRIKYKVCTLTRFIGAWQNDCFFTLLPSVSRGHPIIAYFFSFSLLISAGPSDEGQRHSEQSLILLILTPKINLKSTTNRVISTIYLIFTALWYVVPVLIFWPAVPNDYSGPRYPMVIFQIALLH